MKLSSSTLNILKNFSLINQGLVVNKDRPVYTKTVSNTLLARCNFDDLNETFAIYDIGGYLNTLSLFNDPDIQFQDTYMKITDGSMVAKRHYSSIDVIDYPLDEHIEIIENLTNDASTDFVLSGDQLSKIIKSSVIMKMDIMKFVADGEFIKVELSDSTNVTADTMEIDLGICNSTFNVRVYVDNFKCLPASYDVSVRQGLILPNGDKLDIVVLINTTLDLTYWVVVTK